MTACVGVTARVWSVAEGIELLAPLRHSDGVAAVAISPDGQLIATASSDHRGEVVGRADREADPESCCGHEGVGLRHRLQPGWALAADRRVEICAYSALVGGDGRTDRPGLSKSTASKTSGL